MGGPFRSPKLDSCAFAKEGIVFNHAIGVVRVPPSTLVSLWVSS
jgi:hypothetical protein